MRYIVELRGNLPDKSIQPVYKQVEVEAENCELSDVSEIEGINTSWFRFTDGNGNTVAAIPFRNVFYIAKKI